LAQATPKNQRKPTALLGHHLGRGLREGVFILSIALGVYFTAALATHSTRDPGWASGSRGVDDIANVGGIVGAWTADLMYFCFGYMAWLFPLAVLYVGWRALRDRKAEAKRKTSNTNQPSGKQQLAIRLGGFILALVAGCGLASLHFSAGSGSLPVDSAGGMLGHFIGLVLTGAVELLGATLLMLTGFLVGITFLTSLSWLALMDHTGHWVFIGLSRLRRSSSRVSDAAQGVKAKRVRKQKVKTVQNRTPPKIEPRVEKIEIGERVQREKQKTLFKAHDGALPPLSLLADAPPHAKGYSKEALEAIAKRVEHKLADFGVEAEVVSVHSGPVITRFELQPAAGVKGSQIANLARDLARALSVMSVRVVEVIPGKPYIGLEVPNEERELVGLTEILGAEVYDKADSKLTLALGKDIAGHPTVVDLAAMPHLLVAGTTGAGKSVAINAMLLSFLYKATPDEVRLILIDPKMLELSVYEGIPHLLTPVVTDMQDAAAALRWSVAEMDRRYKLMSALGVRNLAGYNKKVKDAIDKGEPIKDPLWKPAQPIVPDMPIEDIPVEEHPTLTILPQIVICIDELADLMLVVGKTVEQLILRIAQKARAAGMHLILATQRPSVDVITGVIRANIPGRIAFQVATKIDSRTILDQMGAETLLGKGDMLFLTPRSPTPTRVHGCFVDDPEVHAVVKFLKEHGEPVYDDDVLNTGEEAAMPGGAGPGVADSEAGGEADPLYDEAVKVVTQSRKASISSVQRRLRVGYNRAARLIEDMEAAGVVSPAEHNGTREVLAPAPPED